MKTDVSPGEAAQPADLLKIILANLRDPAKLNGHPWARSLPGAGQKLVEVTVRAFYRLLPPGPPRVRKSLDTRWAVFGLLAAQYFAPLELGKPFPSSLREAWESLDESILFFVYGQTTGLSEAEIAKYRLAGNETEPAPSSTLSDWQRKGLTQLLEMVQLERELEAARPGLVRRKIFQSLGLAAGLLLLLLTVFLGWQAWRLSARALSVEQKLAVLDKSLEPAPKLEQLPEISTRVRELHLEVDALQAEAAPYLWLVPSLGWIPGQGGTLCQAGDLLAMTQALVTAADEGLTALGPAVETALREDQPLEPLDLVLQLQATSPQLLAAQVSLARAQEARSRLHLDGLDPQIRKLIENRVDPLFRAAAGDFSMQDALTLVRIAPRLLGSGSGGPQTYLLLMQNEDELRPTGGFLTAAGTVVVKDGKLLSLQISSSDRVDDLKKPYPIPPWQFEQLMNIQMFLFRDSNWFTNFPTTASWAEYFYSYGQSVAVDGLMTIDMHVIVRLLEVLGPVQVASVDFPVTSDNVETYLRSAEKAPPAGARSAVWDRKGFLAELAQPLVEKILAARGETWTRLAPVLIELLDEKHSLLQFDDPEAAALLQRRSWDGAVRPPAGSDFLLAVDANLGYNKSNARMTSALEYQVDLTTPTRPVGRLRFEQTNHSPLTLPCEPWSSTRYLLSSSETGEILDPYYNIDECHWGYLRVYLSAGAQLLHANPQAVPAEATMLGGAIPARVDDLGSEDLPGVQVFGVLVLTPTHSASATDFEYALPGGVLSSNPDGGTWTYRLKVQKQPGQLAQPFTLALRLPEGMKIKKAAPPLTESDGLWTAQLDLRRDLTLEVVFGN
jgi:hypothetical protein